MDKLLKFNNKLIKSGNNVVGKIYDSGLYYRDMEETVGTAINKQFSINIDNDPNYVVAKFDWKSLNPDYYAYNRNCCGAPVRCHYNIRFHGNLQPIISTNSYSATSTNEVKGLTHNSTYTLYALDTDISTYSTVKYIWDYNSNNFSAYVDDVWRFKGEKETDFSNFGNFTCTNEQGGSMAANLYLKNLKIGWFDTLNAAEQW